MRAMILAAGLGTRLRPLTDDRPKALVEIGGRTLLEITLTRLRSFGISEVIVNVHHFADMVVDYLHAKDNFGMHIEISREDELLDTGGGLKQARSSSSTAGRTVPRAQRGCPQLHRSPAHGGSARRTSRIGHTGGATARDIATPAVRCAAPIVRKAIGRTGSGDGAGRFRTASARVLRNSRDLAAAYSRCCRKKVRSRSSIVICGWRKRKRRSSAFVQTNTAGGMSGRPRASRRQSMT